VPLTPSSPEYFADSPCAKQMALGEMGLPPPLALVRAQALTSMHSQSCTHTPLSCSHLHRCQNRRITLARATKGKGGAQEARRGTGVEEKGVGETGVGERMDLE
jgi:hypothetical protein